MKSSTDKSSKKPPPGDKTLGLDLAIRFYEIKDSHKTQEVEDV